MTLNIKQLYLYLFSVNINTIITKISQQPEQIHPLLAFCSTKIAKRIKETAFTIPKYPLKKIYILNQSDKIERAASHDATRSMIN